MGTLTHLVTTVPLPESYPISSSSGARDHVDEVFGGGGLGGREGGPLHLGPVTSAAAVVAVPDDTSLRLNVLCN